MYYTLVTKYLHSGDVKGYSHYDAATAMAELAAYKDSPATYDIVVITDKFYAGDDVDMSIFDRSK